MTASSRNRPPVIVTANPCRFDFAFKASITQLAIIIVAPSPETAIFSYGYTVGFSSCYGHPVTVAADLSGPIFVIKGTVS